MYSYFYLYWLTGIDRKIENGKETFDILDIVLIGHGLGEGELGSRGKRGKKGFDLLNSVFF